MKVEDFESRPHKAVSFVIEREGRCKNRANKRCQKTLPGNSGGRLPGRRSEEKGREEEEEEDRKERQVKNEIAQRVFASIKKKASALEDAKPTSQRAVGRKVRHNWDCSQIEDRDKEELMEGRIS